MKQGAAFLHFRRVLDQPESEREVTLGSLDPEVAALVRRMIAVETDDDLKLTARSDVIGHAVRELRADEQEATGEVPTQIGPIAPWSASAAGLRPTSTSPGRPRRGA